MVNVEAFNEALANILDNACRHARSSVDISVFATPGVVRVSVRDDGPGLPEGAEEQVFGRFVSLDAAGGAGLGLPIARGILRAQGGDLRYTGDRFVLRVRAAPDAPRRAPKHPSEPASNAGPRVAADRAE